MKMAAQPRVMAGTQGAWKLSDLTQVPSRNSRVSLGPQEMLRESQPEDKQGQPVPSRGLDKGTGAPANARH